jgi:hypothetical protein
MASIDLGRLEQRARRRYEWARLRRAALGFAPAVAIIAGAALLGGRPRSALSFGCTLFVAGAFLLWYGRDVRRAVLPGLAFGLVPLALALCATRVGHVCNGEHCMSVCVPACSLGGVLAGLAIAAIGHRGKHRWPFWAGASSIALLTGAMGCSCVGYSGVIGLSLGFAIGLVPGLVRQLLAPKARMDG